MGAAFAVYVNTIPGQPLSTCEAEKSAEVLALARAMGFKDLLNQIDMPQPKTRSTRGATTRSRSTSPTTRTRTRARGTSRRRSSFLQGGVRPGGRRVHRAACRDGAQPDGLLGQAGRREQIQAVLPLLGEHGQPSAAHEGAPGPAGKRDGRVSAARAREPDEETSVRGCVCAGEVTGLNPSIPRCTLDHTRSTLL